MSSNINDCWIETLRAIMTRGKFTSPRGMLTRELRQHTVQVDMARPVLYVPLRKLSYRFLAAEALWILDGDNRVETIAPYNPNIAKFSDDGQTFFGAYGPRIAAQFNYVVNKLRSDRDTRQAFMTIWRENPPLTKDVPCTVAIGFSIRGEYLNAHVFMRSSDAWLGLPYDTFNFSMLAVKVACALNRTAEGEAPVYPGDLYLTMASSHLYAENFLRAEECIKSAGLHSTTPSYTMPLSPIFNGDWGFYEGALKACRDNHEHGWRIRP